MWKEQQSLKIRLNPREVYEHNVKDVILSKLQDMNRKCFNNIMIMNIVDVTYDQVGVNAILSDGGVIYNVTFSCDAFKCFVGDMALVRADIVQTNIIMLSNGLISGNMSRGVTNVGIAKDNLVVVNLQSVTYSIGSLINTKMTLYNPNPIVYKISMTSAERSSKFHEYLDMIKSLDKQISADPNSAELLTHLFTDNGNPDADVMTDGKVYLHVNSPHALSFYSNTDVPELTVMTYSDSSDYLALYPIYNRMKVVIEILSNYDNYKQTKFVWDLYEQSH